MYLGEITDSKSKVKDMHEPICTRNQDNCAGLLLWVTSLHLPKFIGGNSNLSVVKFAGRALENN